MDREKGAKEMLSGCVAVVWQNRLGSIERLNDPTVERRQPSMILSLRARSVRALELFLYDPLLAFFCVLSEVGRACRDMQSDVSAVAVVKTRYT